MEEKIKVICGHIYIDGAKVAGYEDRYFKHFFQSYAYHMLGSGLYRRGKELACKHGDRTRNGTFINKCKCILAEYYISADEVIEHYSQFVEPLADEESTLRASDALKKQNKDHVKDALDKLAELERQNAKLSQDIDRMRDGLSNAVKSLIEKNKEFCAMERDAVISAMADEIARLNAELAALKERNAHKCPTCLEAP